MGTIYKDNIEEVCRATIERQVREELVGGTLSAQHKNLESTLDAPTRVQLEDAKEPIKKKESEESPSPKKGALVKKVVKVKKRKTQSSSEGAQEEKRTTEEPPAPTPKKKSAETIGNAKEATRIQILPKKALAKLGPLLISLGADMEDRCIKHMPDFVKNPCHQSVTMLQDA